MINSQSFACHGRTKVILCRRIFTLRHKDLDCNSVVVFYQMEGVQLLEEVVNSLHLVNS